MAKKSGGRQANKARKRMIVQPQASTPAVESDAIAPVTIPEPSLAPRAAVGLRRPGAVAGAYAPRRERASVAPVPSDYSYIGHELRRIGTLLAIILAVMVGLTFTLPALVP